MAQMTLDAPSQDAQPSHDNEWLELYDPEANITVYANPVRHHNYLVSQCMLQMYCLHILLCT